MQNLVDIFFEKYPYLQVDIKTGQKFLLLNIAISISRIQPRVSIIYHCYS